MTNTISPIAAPPNADIARIHILSINDLHGQITDSDAKKDGVDIGGAATLSAYIQHERALNPNGTVLVSAGDLVGASPPASTLLKHQSSMAVLSAMGVDIATLGNHEFDKGYAEAIRLIYGDGPVADAAKAAQGLNNSKKKKGAIKTGSTAKASAKAGWIGSAFPWINANLVDTKTNRRILPPYAIKEVDGIKVAFIGVVTADLKNVTTASGIRNLKVLDPAKAINDLIPEIKAKGATAIVVIAHEGAAPTKETPEGISGPIVTMTKALSPEVNAVISGHSHKEYATRIDGRPIVQAGSYAAALGVLDLNIDKKTGKVISSDVRVVRNNENAVQPDKTIDKMVKLFEAKVAPKTERIIGSLDTALTKERTDNGQTSMGAVIADAQRLYTKSDVGLMNVGGVRANLAAGKVTWGALFAVQPFGNRVNTIELTGSELKAALEEQFTASRTNILQVSGLKINIDLTKPMGSRIMSVTMLDGSPLDPKKTYKVAINGFVIDGGDGYTKFKSGRKRVDVTDDLTTLITYFKNGGKAPIDVTQRITINGGSLPTDEH